MPKPHSSSNEPLHSRNSGNFDPGPPERGDMPTEELAIVQSHTLDLALEEFPEGPYGAATNAEKLGKVSEWKPQQAFSGRFRDSNLIESDRKVALEEPPAQGGDDLERQN